MFGFLGDLFFLTVSGNLTEHVDFDDFNSVITAVTNYFSVSDIVGILAAVVGAGIVFAFLWWAVRLAFNSIMGAVKRGTLSINSRRGRRR